MLCLWGQMRDSCNSGGISDDLRLADRDVAFIQSICVERFTGQLRIERMYCTDTWEPVMETQVDPRPSTAGLELLVSGSYNPRIHRSSIWKSAIRVSGVN